MRNDVMQMILYIVGLAVPAGVLLQRTVQRDVHQFIAGGCCRELRCSVGQSDDHPIVMAGTTVVDNPDPCS